MKIFKKSIDNYRSTNVEVTTSSRKMVIIALIVIIVTVIAIAGGVVGALVAKLNSLPNESGTSEAKLREYYTIFRDFIF